MLVVGSAGAQDTSEKQPDSKVDAIIRMSGISPAVGATFQIGNSRLRALGFVSIDSRGFNSFDKYILSLSYIRDLNWMASGAVNWYWGVNFHQEFADPKVGPGVLVGSSYSIGEHFELFGEAALNVFFFDDGANGQVGMSNSGIGLRVSM